LHKGKTLELRELVLRRSLEDTRKDPSRNWIEGGSLSLYPAAGAPGGGTETEKSKRRPMGIPCPPRCISRPMISKKNRKKKVTPVKLRGGKRSGHQR